MIKPSGGSCTAPDSISPTSASIVTLGCKTNQFESASMQQSLVAAGYQIIPFEDGAELVIVNTCTVTNATDAQSRNLIRRAQRLNPSARVIVTGCYAQIDPEALSGLPGVSLVIGNEEKKRLLDYLRLENSQPVVEVSDIRQAESTCLPPLTSFAGRSRAFVQIQNGCDAFCTYCIIPYARGASRSISVDEVVARIKELVANGYQEVVLTGIHIGGYGVDLRPATSLLELVYRIETETVLSRLRLGSIEPTEIPDQLIDKLASSTMLCPHFHIPLQSGDDAVLKRMGRTYDSSFFAALVERISLKCPDAAIALDVITGFPGESDVEFENTFKLIEGLPISDLHVFPYSKRPGTPAADMSDQVSADISKGRAERLRRLAAEKQGLFARGFIGERLEVVVEKQGLFARGFIGERLEVVVENAPKDGMLKGLSRNYLDVRFAGDEALAGKCVDVHINNWVDGVLLGEVRRS